MISWGLWFEVILWRVRKQEFSLSADSLYHLWHVHSQSRRGNIHRSESPHQILPVSLFHQRKPKNWKRDIYLFIIFPLVSVKIILASYSLNLAVFLGYAANEQLYLQVKGELKEEKGKGVHKEPKESSEEKQEGNTVEENSLKSFQMSKRITIVTILLYYFPVFFFFLMWV